MACVVSKDGRRAHVRYTTFYSKDYQYSVMRYFVVPEDIQTGEFCPGFLTRQEACDWWQQHQSTPKTPKANTKEENNGNIQP